MTEKITSLVVRVDSKDVTIANSRINKLTESSKKLDKSLANVGKQAKKALGVTAELEANNERLKKKVAEKRKQDKLNAASPASGKKEEVSFFKKSQKLFDALSGVASDTKGPESGIYRATSSLAKASDLLEKATAKNTQFVASEAFAKLAEISKGVKGENSDITKTLSASAQGAQIFENTASQSEVKGIDKEIKAFKKEYQKKLAAIRKLHGQQSKEEQQLTKDRNKKLAELEAKRAKARLADTRKVLVGLSQVAGSTLGQDADETKVLASLSELTALIERNNSQKDPLAASDFYKGLAGVAATATSKDSDVVKALSATSASASVFENVAAASKVEGIDKQIEALEKDYQKKLLAIRKQHGQQSKMEQDLTKDRNKKLAELEAKKTNVMLENTSKVFGGLAKVAENSLGEGADEAKVLASISELSALIEKNRSQKEPIDASVLIKELAGVAATATDKDSDVVKSLSALSSGISVVNKVAEQSQVEAIDKEIDALEKGFQTKLEAIRKLHGQQSELEIRLTKERNDKLAELEAQRTSANLNDASDLFGGLAGVASEFEGEDSDAYKTLNAASGIFSVFDTALEESDTSGIEDEETKVEEDFQAKLELIREQHGEQSQLEEDLTNERNDKLADLEQQKTQTMLSSGNNLFSGLATIAAGAAGKQSSAYKAMFAVSKGFSLAQTAMSIATGIGRAQELGFPANIAEMARVAIQGASALATIRGSNFSGAHDHGGMIPAGKVGLVGEYGPELIAGPAQITSRRTTESMGLYKSAKQPGMPQEPKSPVTNISFNPTIITRRPGDIMDEIESVQKPLMRMIQSSIDIPA